VPRERVAPWAGANIIIVKMRRDTGNDRKEGARSEGGQKQAAHDPPHSLHPSAAIATKEVVELTSQGRIQDFLIFWS